MLVGGGVDGRGKALQPRNKIQLVSRAIVDSCPVPETFDKVSLHLIYGSFRRQS